MTKAEFTKKSWKLNSYYMFPAKDAVCPLGAASLGFDGIYYITVL